MNQTKFYSLVAISNVIDTLAENDFRKMLLTMEQENITLKVENASLKACTSQQKKKVTALEGHLCKTESQIDSLLRKLNSANDTIRNLQQEVRNQLQIK